MRTARLARVRKHDHGHHVLGVAATVAVGAFAALIATGSTASAAGSSPAAAPASAPAVVEPLVSPFARLVATGVEAAAEATETMTASATPPPQTWYCPAPEAEFIDSWGFARSGGRRHKGVDMMAPYGSPVVAPTDGVVRHKSSALGGLSFYLTDDDGNEYYGTHMATVASSGRVEAGTILGTVGSSGNASTPHLHFEVKLAQGGTVNPYPFAAAWCGVSDRDPFSA